MSRPLLKLAMPFLGAAMFMPSTAQAVSCGEIITMHTKNVPSNIIISAMENSGRTYTSEDIGCLTGKSAPADIVSAARRLGGAAPAPAPVAAPTGAAPMPNVTDKGFDGADMLGADMPEADEPEPAGASPAEIETAVQYFKSKKYISSSQALYDLLERGDFPDQKTKIQYHLAKSLYELGMYHGAQHYFMQVVRRGPKNPYFKYALPKLVSIAEYTGNDAELLRIVHKIPPEAFPGPAKNHLYYLMGRKLYDKKELTESANNFKQISAKSDLYMRAKYFEGVIHNERGRLKSAVMSFREVMTAEPPIATTDARRSAEIEDLKDLALINVARIYYGLQRFDNADNYYKMVQRDSMYWPESLFERAWTNFHRQDMNLALGLLLTVESPYFNEVEYIPEVTVLRALTFFTLCEYTEVERLLINFENNTRPMVGEMDAFLTQYATADGMALADQAFDAYFADSHDSSELDNAMFSRMLRNRSLAALVRHMDMMDDEIAAIDSQKGAWKTTIGDALKKQIEQDRARYKRKAGGALLREMKAQMLNLEDLLTQSEIVRFEVADAQRMDYEFKMQNPNVDALSDTTIDFATSRDIIYWPFNGEFWADELGYYRYTEHGACK
jgi:tetratricopeptide (TPR) repeat protein